MNFENFLTFFKLYKREIIIINIITILLSISFIAFFFKTSYNTIYTYNAYLKLSYTNNDNCILGDHHRSRFSSIFYIYNASYEYLYEKKPTTITLTENFNFLTLSKKLFLNPIRPNLYELNITNNKSININSLKEKIKESLRENIIAACEFNVKFSDEFYEIYEVNFFKKFFYVFFIFFNMVVLIRILFSNS